MLKGEDSNKEILQKKEKRNPVKKGAQLTGKNE